MASFRKLPSGKWQAQVKYSGRQYYRTDPLKRVVAEWATKTEAELRRGTFVDPALGRVTVGEWWQVWADSWDVETSTSRKRASQWSNHIEPTFGRWQVAAVQPSDVEAWLGEHRRSGTGQTTVSESFWLLGQCFRYAVRQGRLPLDPTASVKGPGVPKHVARIMTIEEVETLLKAITMTDHDARAGLPRDKKAPRVPDLVSRTLVKSMTDAGLRYQEAGGLHGFRVDLKRKRVRVQEVLRKDGSIKPIPKTAAGQREVALTDELCEELGPLVTGAGREGLVFSTGSGGPLLYDNWLKRTWNHAIGVAGLRDPQPTPHDCRHSYGTWLADQGLPPHQIKDLMGHSSLRAVEIYINTSEARMEAARKALGARRAHGPSGQARGPASADGENGA